MKNFPVERIQTIIFDWGDTLMRDIPGMAGPMASWDSVEVVPGAIDLLECLYGRFTLVVATNAGESDERLVRTALKRGGIEYYFNAVITAKERGLAKSDPAFFSAALNRVGALPGESVSFGDRYDKDIIPAKAAGLYTAWFNRRQERRSAPDADIVVQSLDELARFFCPNRAINA